MSRDVPLRKVVPGLWATFRQLWPYVRQHRMLIAGSFTSLFFAIGMRLLEPWPLKVLFDRIFIVGHRAPRFDLSILRELGMSATIALIAAAIVLIAALRAGAEFFNTVGFSTIGNRVLTEVRNDLYRHLQRLSLAFHNRSRSGDLVLRVMSDVNMLRDVAVTALLPLIGSALTLVGMIGVMLWMNWRLALLSLATLPLFALAAMRLTRRIREAAGKQRKREGSLASTAAESISAIKIVQALSLEDRFADHFMSRSRKAGGEDVKVSRLSASLERSVDVLIAISTAATVLYGGRLVITGVLTPGDLYVFLTYLKRAFNPVQDFAKYTGRLAKALAAGERVLEVLHQEPDVADAPGAVEAPPFRGDVAFEHVSFGYEEGRTILDDVTFSASAGERIALVGPSGMGKSTLVSLLLRLYEPLSGRVTIDGRDVHEYTIRSLRSQISVVMQETILFADTVWENIGLGAGSTDREEILAAARLANADEFIRRFPAGYDTVLGERGVTLSGGERQRIAIARAAIRRAPILILDEPATGLDEENEREVMEALERLAVGRTSFVISHDLRMAARSDRILYIEGGRIVEHGSHRELMAQGGRYATLYLLQGASDEQRGEDVHAFS